MPRPLNETPEQRRKRLDKQKEYWRKRSAEVTPEQKKIRYEKDVARRRKRREEETPEERRIRLERVQEKSRFSDLVRNITMTEEEKEKKRKSRYFYWQANKWRWNFPNLSEEKRQHKLEVHRRWRESLTGEKKERHLESVRRTMRKTKKKKYDKMKQNPEEMNKFLQYQRERYARETPEQRLRRRRKDKMNGAKRKLKRKLEEEGTSPKEIEMQLNQLGEKMWREFYPEGGVPIPGKNGRPRKEEINTVPAAVVHVENLSAEKHLISTSDSSTNVQFELQQISIERKDSTRTLESPDPQGSEFVSPAPSTPSSPATDFEDGADLVVIPTTTSLSCSYCSFIAPSDQQLRSHIFSCHSDNCWKCPKCQVVVLSSQELSQHYGSIHKNVPSQSVTSDATSCSKASTDDHWDFVCLKCPPGPLEKFQNRENLFEHVKNEHPSCFWPCQGCRLLKYSEHAFRLHKTVCQFL